MSGHTEGKLKLFADDVSSTIAIDDDRGAFKDARTAVVHWTGFDASDKPFRVKKANARRLVACWNACIGISTETLEHEVKPGHWARSNAELIDALRDMLEHTRRLIESHRTLERERGSVVGTLASNSMKSWNRADALLSRHTPTSGTNADRVEGIKEGK